MVKCSALSRLFAVFFFTLPLYHFTTLPLAYAASGKTTAGYLRSDVGGRAVGMGGTQFGAENDSFAQFYNPALLSGVNQKEIGFMHNEYFEDLRQEVFSYVQPTENRGNFAVTVNYFGYGKIQGWDADGAVTGDLSATDMSFGATWARAWNFVAGESTIDNLSTGASLKILRKKLHNDSGTAFALDAGVAYPFALSYVRGLKFGLSAMNLGSGIKFKQGSSPLPKMLRAGLAYSWFGDALTGAVDQVIPFETEPYQSLGLEYKIRKMFSLRIGYKNLRTLEQKLSYGVGFENPLFRLDYAFIPFGDLGDTHRISVNYRFGRASRRPKADTQLKEKLKEAQALRGQGLLVDAYMLSFQIQRVAPWMDENNALMEKIQKDIRELEVAEKREKIQQQVDALIARGEKFFDEGNIINAKLEFEAAKGLQPDSKTALGYLSQIDAQFRSFIESFYRAGMLAMAGEDYEKAVKEFNRVLQLDPEHPDAKVQLEKARGIIEETHKEQALEAQKDLIEKTASDGIAAFKDEHFEESLRLLGEVLQVNPNHEEAKKYAALAKETLYKQYLAAANEHLSKGSWEAAIKNLKRAVEVNPSSKEAKSLLDDAQRKSELQKRVQSQNLYKSGLEKFLANEKDGARTDWKKALELDPENEEARRGLQRLGQ